MTEERKKYLDSLWMDTDVGKWAIFKSEEKQEEADKILERLSREGWFLPYERLMSEEKELSEKVKSELNSMAEGKEYVLELEKSDYDLVGIMVAHEFALLDMYYE